MAHEVRWGMAEQIAELLKQHYAERLLALGVYGSLGRGSDGPYSDIEMHCVIDGGQIDTAYEWSSGGWKAEVDVYSPDTILAEAAEVEGDWPITHGAFVNVKTIFDPDGLFPRLARVVMSHPDIVFKERMEEVIVGEIYELVGKIRNASVRHDLADLPARSVKLATFAACLQGLRHRHLFTSSGRIFEEALALPDAPEGLDQLLEMVSSGELSDPVRILSRTDEYWAGLATWANNLNLRITTSLEALLQEHGK